MTDFYADNPLTMVYTQLWTILEARIEANTLVIQGNRIRFDQDRDPLKDNISTADVPEVLIAVEGMLGNIKASSTSTSILVAYSVRGTTGDFRYNLFLAQIQWFLLGCLVDWRNTLGTLEWQGNRFIHRVNMESDTLGISEIDDLQGGVRKAGWANLLRFNVGMSFKTSDVALGLTNQI